MSSSQVRVAVIGLGMGFIHARQIDECPEADLVAVVDLNPEAFKKLDGKIALKPEQCYTDHKTMLKEVSPDLVTIALPNALHKPVTLDCLAAGSNVLCEKPMAMTVHEARDMKAAAEEAGLQLGIHLSTRFGGASRAMKEMVDNGALGDPYHAYTRWTRRDGFPRFGGWFGQQALSGGGPLIDLGVHRIDLAMWLMGSPSPVTVSGTTHKRIGVPRAAKQGLKFDVEDFAAGFVRFDNGASLIFEVSWAGHEDGRDNLATRIMGTEGGFEVAKKPGTWEMTPYYYHEVNGQKLNSEIVVGKNQYRKSVEEMILAVRDGTTYLATPDDGIHVQQVLNGLYKSAELGREVTMDEIED